MRNHKGKLLVILTGVILVTFCIRAIPRDHQDFVLVNEPDFAPLDLWIREDLNPQDCVPKTKFAFMKTHKTASRWVFLLLSGISFFATRMHLFSSIQNLLFRQTFRRDLNIVMKEHSHLVYDQSHWEVPFNSSMLNGVAWHNKFYTEGLYDAFILHTKWNYQEVR